MDPIKNIVLGTTLFLIAYVVLASIPSVPVRLIIGMFSLSPFLIIYMVWRVLTAGESSLETFEESFYEDHEYQRVKSPIK
jgi:hypothetical protein